MGGEGTGRLRGGKGGCESRNGWADRYGLLDIMKVNQGAVANVKEPKDNGRFHLQTVSVSCCTTTIQASDYRQRQFLLADLTN